MKLTKTFATVALSATMATCVGLAISNANWNAHTLAYAQTAQSTVTRSKIFEKNGITVSQTESQSFELTGVSAGQYSVTLTQDPLPTPPPYDPDDPSTWPEYFDVILTVNGESVFMNQSYNEDGVFYAVITVKGNDTLTVSTTKAESVTYNLTLDTLFVSENSGLSLSNINIPSKENLNIDILDSTASSYTVIVDLGEVDLEEGAQLRAYIGDTFVILHKDSAYYTNTYTGTITATPSGTAVDRVLTLYSTNSTALTANISLVELSAVYAMENNAGTATLGEWETAIFSYVAPATGYKSFTVSSASEETVVAASVTYGLSAGTFTGTAVAGEDYPVYLEKDQTYYFEVTVESITPAAENAKAEINVNIADWTKPQVTPNANYALPAIPADSTEAQIEEVTMVLNAAEGDYDIAISEVPFEFYSDAVVITAHIGAQTIALNGENNYSATVSITNENSIYLTTSQASRTVVTLNFAKHEEILPIEPDKLTEITVPANGSITYVLEAADAGVYSVALGEASAYVSVWVNDEYPIIPEGKTTGGFVVRNAGTDFGITFKNSSANDIKINAIVTSDNEATLQLNTQNALTLTAGQRRSFFMYNLAAGDFELKVDPATSLTLTVDGEAVDISSGTAKITISEAQDTNGVVNFTFENSSSAEVKFNVTVTPENIVTLNEKFEITTTDYYYYTAYYVKLTQNVNYVMVLNLPEGMSVTVTQNGEEFVHYGNVIGTFMATTSDYTTLRFNCYTYGDLTTLSAYITEYTDNVTETMEVGVSKEVTVKEYYTQYKITLTEGAYYVNLSGNVEVAINGTLVSKNTSYYCYNATEEVLVTFINFTGAPVTATAMIVNGFMNVDEETYITLNANSSAVYAIDLTSGLHTVTLTFSDGATIEVMYNGGTIINAGGTSGSFYVSVSGVNTLTFKNTGTEMVTFTVKVAG